MTSGVIFGGSYSPAVINTHQTQFTVSDQHIVTKQQRLKASVMTLYTGYQFDHGWRVLVGAAQTDTAYIADGVAFSEKQTAPMIGMGYQTPSGVHFDLHATQVEYAGGPATTLFIMMGTRI
ncbi:hypothetical protein L4C36_11220 [Photobacterium japonica]|uniref:hypothetical protein n=1 Tax=Photobacterium japonica TaxID=2910235 RepID=UPI003D0DD9AA